jgi:hypothetical protein
MSKSAGRESTDSCCTSHFSEGGFGHHVAVNERPGALVVAVAIRYSTRNASDATGDDPQGVAEAPIDPRQHSGC